MSNKVELALRCVGYAKIAREVNLTRQAVHQWKGRVPAEHVMDVAPLIGLEPWQIRPDVFRAPERCEGTV